MRFGETFGVVVLDDAVGGAEGLDGAVVAAPGAVVFFQKVPQRDPNPALY